MAVRFDAVSESYTRTVSLGEQTTFTFAMWARLRANRSVSTTLWSFDDNADGTMFGFRTTTDGASLRVFDDIDGGAVASGPVMSANVWYYLSAVFDYNSIAGNLFYRTASAAALTQVFWTVNSPRTITRLLIGDGRYVNEWFNGNIAGFKFWTATLSPTELLNESRQIKPRRTADLRAFYPFTRAETTDYSGNGQTLTGGATATTEDGPPVSWYGAGPRITIGAGAAAPVTNAPAENAPYSVTANNPATSIQVSAECATFAVAAVDPAASIRPAALDAAIGVAVSDPADSVSPVGELAALTVPAADPAALVAPLSDVAGLAVPATDPAALVSPVGDVAGLSVVSVDTAGLVALLSDVAGLAVLPSDPAALVAPLSDVAGLNVVSVDAAAPVAPVGDVAGLSVVSVDAATGTAPGADSAAVTVSANDPTVAVPGDLLAGNATCVLSAHDASVSSVSNVTATAEAVTFTVAADDAGISTSVSAEPATFTVSADDAAASTSVSGTANAEAATFTLSGNDPFVSSAGNTVIFAETALFGLSAFDPAPSLGVIAITSGMTFDGLDLSSLIRLAGDVSLISFIAEDAFIGRQGGGTIEPADRPISTMEPLDRPIQTHRGADRDIQQMYSPDRSVATMNGGT